MRKSKWWYSVFWWGLQVLLVNTNVTYSKYSKLRGIKSLSHYEFQRNVALAWIDKDEYANPKKTFTTPKNSDGGSGGEEDASTLTSNSTGGGQKKDSITDFTLDPDSGSLKRRLNHSVGHWPTRGDRGNEERKGHCQLHKWACGNNVRKRSNTAYCQV